jgi:Na+/phosphate symporter
MASQAPSPRTRLVGGLALWFAVLGGALAWALHEVAAWGTDELTCASGHETVSGAPLRVVLGLMVVIPLVVALAALGMAWIAWRRLSRAERDAERAGHGERRLSRAGMMALVALGADLIFVAIIVFGGVGLLVLPPCQR